MPKKVLRAASAVEAVPDENTMKLRNDSGIYKTFPVLLKGEVGYGQWTTVKGYKAEGFTLFVLRVASPFDSFGTGSTPSQHPSVLYMIENHKVFDVFSFIESNISFFKDTYDSWSAASPVLMDFGRAHKAEVRLLCASGDLFDIVNPPAVGVLSPFQAALPLLDDHTDVQFAAAALVLLLGPRYTLSQLTNAGGTFQLVSAMLENYVKANRKFLGTARLRAWGVHSIVRVLLPASFMFSICEDPSLCVTYLGHLMQFSQASVSERESIISAVVALEPFRLKNIAKLVQNLTAKGLDLLTELRPLYKDVCGGGTSDEVTLVYTGLNGSFATKQALLDSVLRKHSGQMAVKELRVLASSSSGGGTGATMPDPADSAGAGASAAPRYTGKHILDEHGKNATLQGGEFLGAQSYWQAHTFGKAFPEGYDLAKLFDRTVHAQGCLLIAQRIFRHPQLKGIHPLLNNMSKLSESVQCSYAGFVLVAKVPLGKKFKKADRKPPGFSLGFSLKPEVWRLWITGRDGEINWLAVVLEVRQAIAGASGFSYEHKLDFILLDADWQAYVDVRQRLASTRGHRTRLSKGEGVTIADLLDALNEYRTLIQQLSEAEQTKLWPEFADLLQLGADEGGKHFLDQMDDTDVAGKHVLGYLPEVSQTTGVMFTLKQRIKGIERMRRLHHQNPGLYASRTTTVGTSRLTSWKMVSKSTDADAHRKKKQKLGGASGGRDDDDDDDGGGDDGRSRQVVIGSNARKVKVLDSEEEYFQMGKKVMGPGSGAVAFLATKGVTLPKDVCKPSLFSSKLPRNRCTMCIAGKGKKSLPHRHSHPTRMAHAIPAKLPKDWANQFTHDAKTFKLPATSTPVPPNGPAAP